MRRFLERYDNVEEIVGSLTDREALAIATECQRIIYKDRQRASDPNGPRVTITKHLDHTMKHLYPNIFKRFAKDGLTHEDFATIKARNTQIIRILDAVETCLCNRKANECHKMAYKISKKVIMTLQIMTLNFVNLNLSRQSFCMETDETYAHLPGFSNLSSLIESEDDGKSGKESKHKLVTEYIYSYCVKKKLRRKDGYIYIPVYTRDEKCTYFWREGYSIVKLPSNATLPKELHSSVYNLMLGGDYASKLKTHLRDLGDDEPSLPILKRDRGLISFDNGIFHIPTNRFFPYRLHRFEDAIKRTMALEQIFRNEHEMPVSVVINEAMELDARKMKKLKLPEICSSNYHRREFTNSDYEMVLDFWYAEQLRVQKARLMCHCQRLYAEGKMTKTEARHEYKDLNTKLQREANHYRWYALESKAYQKILDSQKWDDAVKKWCYVLGVGKMLFPLRRHDGWQIKPFFHGIAGTGKSSLLMALRNIYEGSDIGILGNKIERQFGLETLHSKFIILGFDLDKGFQMDQTQWQSTVTGEPVNIARKGKPALNIMWTTPGADSGNDFPKFLDNRGQVSRRLAVFDHQQHISKRDPQLGSRLLQESAIFIKKGLCAYRLENFYTGDKDLWTDGVFPDYFHEKKKKVQEQTVPFQSFLKNENLLELAIQSGEEDSPVALLEDRFYIPLARLKSMFEQHLQQNSKMYGTNIKSIIPGDKDIQDILVLYRLQTTTLANLRYNQPLTFPYGTGNRMRDDELMVLGIRSKIDYAQSSFHQNRSLSNSVSPRSPLGKRTIEGDDSLGRSDHPDQTDANKRQRL